MVYIPSWLRRLLMLACCLLCVGLAGCDQTKPEKFVGFASEQLSEQIEIVSAKLDESIEDANRNQVAILEAVRELSHTVAGMQLTSQSQINELKKVASKAKTKLTFAGDEKDGVATLDPNAAPSAKLQLDSLDDAAAQIEALTKRIDELEKRCKGMSAAAPATGNYPSVSSGSGGNSSGSLKSGGSTGSLQTSSYQAPVYSYTVQEPVVVNSAAVLNYQDQPIYQSQPSQPVFQSSTSSTCYQTSTGEWVCDKNMSKTTTQQPVRRGLLGRVIGR